MASGTSGSRMQERARVGAMRAGDRVRVKSRQEILGTLDANAGVAGLPFMPEMLKFAGETLPVDAVVHRTCDTIGDYPVRGMVNTVHLEGARCDGSAHGGCQARCLLFWRTEWLVPADPEIDPADQDGLSEDSPSDVPSVLLAATQGEGYTDEDPVYSCQATQMLNAHV